MLIFRANPTWQKFAFTNNNTPLFDNIGVKDNANCIVLLSIPWEDVDRSFIAFNICANC